MDPAVIKRFYNQAAKFSPEKLQLLLFEVIQGKLDGKFSSEGEESLYYNEIYDVLMNIVYTPTPEETLFSSIITRQWNESVDRTFFLDEDKKMKVHFMPVHNDPAFIEYVTGILNFSLDNYARKYKF